MTGEFVSAVEQADGTWLITVRLTYQGQTFLLATLLQTLPTLTLLGPAVGDIIPPEGP